MAVSICFSLKTGDLCISLFVICVSSLETCLFSFLFIFLLGYLSSYWIFGVLHIPSLQFFVRRMFADMLSQSVAFLFIYMAYVARPLSRSLSSLRHVLSGFWCSWLLPSFLPQGLCMCRPLPGHTLPSSQQLPAFVFSSPPLPLSHSLLRDSALPLCSVPFPLLSFFIPWLWS